MLFPSCNFYYSRTLSASDNRKLLSDAICKMQSDPIMSVNLYRDWALIGERLEIYARPACPMILCV